MEFDKDINAFVGSGIDDELILGGDFPVDIALGMDFLISLRNRRRMMTERMQELAGSVPDEGSLAFSLYSRDLQELPQIDVIISVVEKYTVDAFNSMIQDDEPG